ncbi:MAG: hypothetical protein SNJ53_07280 [Thermodesulfovibrionales bacterium]
MEENLKQQGKDSHIITIPETKGRNLSNVIVSIAQVFTPELRVRLPVFLIALLFCYFLSCYVRYGQYQTWLQEPSLYFYEKSPLMTAADAYYWLSEVKAYLAGQLNLLHSGSPMLIFLIAKLSPFFDNDLYKTGSFIIIPLAGMFMIPLGLIFYRLGLPSTALLAGLVGTFSLVYMERSSFGRVDTDTLQLFFPALGALFVMLINKERTNLQLIILATLAGLSMYLFKLWYPDKGYIILFFTASMLYLFFQKIPLKKLAVGLAVLIVAFNPTKLKHYIAAAQNTFNRYFNVKESIVIDGVSYPNVIATIGEASQLQISDILNYVISNQILSVLGLIGFLLCAIVNWRRLLPILPLFAAGLMAFIGAPRLGIFLAPFVGAGIGYLLDILFGAISRRFRIEGKAVLARDAVVNTLAILFFFVISAKTAYSYIPAPSLPATAFSSLHDIKKIMTPNSAIFTWWDHGYAIRYVTDRPVFHDGSSQVGPNTYLAAKAYVSDQRTMHNLVRCIGSEGGDCYIQSSGAKGPVERLKVQMNYNGKIGFDNIYALYTFDMVHKFGAISFLGSWDFREGTGIPYNYTSLQCMGIVQNLLMCKNATINLQEGTMNNYTKLRRIIVVRDGIVEREINYPTGDNTLQILIRDNVVFATLLLDESLYQTAFNQIYLLGRYDKTLYEEVYNNFPHVRLFRLRFN